MSTFAAALAFAGRDFRVARSYRIPFVMTILASVMTLITFRFIAELVGDAEAIRATGDYFSFVVVGMVMAAVLDGTIAAPAAAARQEQVQGTLEVLATQPLRPRALAAGWTAYPIIESLITGAGMLLVALPLGFSFAGANVLPAIPALALSAIVFAGLGMLGAATVLVLQQAGGITRWVAGAMSLVSGVFFPVSLFPRWMQVLAEASPMTHSLRALRGTLLQGQGFGDVAGSLLALALAAAVLVPAGVGLLSLALKRARARGTVSTY